MGRNCEGADDSISFDAFCKFPGTQIVSPEIPRKAYLTVTIQPLTKHLVRRMDEKGRDYVRSRMPLIGVGTYQIRSKDVILDVLDEALRTGYRMIDTAQCYNNEKHIGNALRVLLPKYNLKREDIFLISKLHPANLGSQTVGLSIEETLSDLGTDYLDLFLIHWPAIHGRSLKDSRNQTAREESWRELEKFYGNGKLRAVGVSNYMTNHLEQLLKQATVLPAVNQCEFHPHYAPFDLVKFCEHNGVIFQAYGSFGSPGHIGELTGDSKVVELAKKYNCTIPQFLLAWSISQGISALPRTTKREHVVENFKASLIKVNDEDVQKAVSEGPRKYSWDPTNVV